MFWVCMSYERVSRAVRVCPLLPAPFSENAQCDTLIDKRCRKLISYACALSSQVIDEWTNRNKLSNWLHDGTRRKTINEKLSIDVVYYSLLNKCESHQKRKVIPMLWTNGRKKKYSEIDRGVVNFDVGWALTNETVDTCLKFAKTTKNYSFSEWTGPML